jgi:hypothetical protein
MDEKVPETLDWVTKRSECSLQLIFDNLREVVKGDVEKANALNRAQFQIHPLTGQKFSISRTRKVLGFLARVVVFFELTETEIVVTRVAGEDDQQQMFSAIPEINQQGLCLLRINGEAGLLRLWQVSKKALEDLFFGF